MKECPCCGSLMSFEEIDWGCFCCGGNKDYWGKDEEDLDEYEIINEQESD